jgi:cell division transport system permease protein
VGVVVNGPFPPRRRLPTVIRNTFRYLFVGAVRAWFRNLGATTPALGSMTLLLVLTGLVGLGAYGIQRLAASQATNAAVLHVYLRDDAKTSDVDALRGRLADDRRVDSVTYVSKADALKRAQHRPGLPDLANGADDNPFPASLEVKLHNVQDVGAVAASSGSSSAVDPILPTSYNPGAYDRIQKVMAVVGVAGAAFLLLLGFVAIAVTANSIRAAIFSRQHEVAIMQLVGAPRWMVRGPFLVEGALTGGVAGLVAGVVTLLASLAAVAAGASTFSQIAPGITVAACLLTAVLVFVAGIVLGAAASLLSVHRQLEGEGT